MESEAESDDSQCRFTVENSYNDEKEQACLSLTEMCKHLGPAFIPFLQPTFQEVFKLLDYPHEDIREAAVLTLEQFCITLNKLPTPENKTALQGALRTLIPKCVEMIHAEEEQNIVTTSITILGNLLDELGSEMFVGNGHKEAIINCIVDILTHKTVCQDQDAGDDTGLDEEGESEQTELLLESTGEVIPKFGKALPNAEFALYFPNIMQLMSIRAVSNRGAGV